MIEKLATLRKDHGATLLMTMIVVTELIEDEALLEIEATAVLQGVER